MLIDTHLRGQAKSKMFTQAVTKQISFKTRENNSPKRADSFAKDSSLQCV